MITVTVSGSGAPPPSVIRKIILDEVETATRQTLLSVEAEWKRNAAPSRKTGTYLRSIFTHVRRSGNLITGVLGTNLRYARFLEYGTGLYGPRKQWIYPRHAKALRFPQPFNPGFTLAGRQRSGKAGLGARWIYAKRVRGIVPRLYATEAFRGQRSNAEAIFRAAAERAAAKIRAV